MIEELKPCPFCGGEAFKILTEWGAYVVQCGMCDVMTAPHCRADHVTEVWNRRIIDDR